MYCDFCKCSTCQTGCSEVTIYNGDKPPVTIKADMPVYHTQCEDGRWICETCYTYECCVDAGSDPTEGECGKKKCSHRPKLVSGEWTFWTFHLGINN